MWRWADSNADDTAYGNAWAYTCYQYPYADIGSANVHPRIYAIASPHSDSHTRTPSNAGAD